MPTGNYLWLSQLLADGQGAALRKFCRAYAFVKGDILLFRRLLIYLIILGLLQLCHLPAVFLSITYP